MSVPHRELPPMQDPTPESLSTTISEIGVVKTLKDQLEKMFFNK
jgi:hypothetical protein